LYFTGMITTIRSCINDFSHLFFPHNCLGCSSDAIEHRQILCAKCFTQLPETGFFQHADNKTEKIFYGRIALQQAGSMYYFTKDSLIQKLIFELKYRGNKTAGSLLGSITGQAIKKSMRFENVDLVIPLPLNPAKEKKRGYNQAAIIAESIASEIQKPLLVDAAYRTVFTQTQTHKGRISRWQNMEGVFAVKDLSAVTGKHILLVDDVLTTGATLESCARCLIQVPGTQISIATVAYTI